MWGIYALSMVLPAIGTPGGYNLAQLGLSEMNIGLWIFVLRTVISFTLNPLWLTNPLIWAGAVSVNYGRWKSALLCGSIATMFAIGGTAWFKSGKGSDQYSLLVGYYAWVAKPFC